MNLQEVLDATGLNRNSYNTLERRTGLPFMKRGLASGRGHDRYYPAHSVALDCMLELQAAAVPAAKAAEAVDAMLPAIWNTVATISEGNAPGWSILHLFQFDDGTWAFAYGAPDATPDDRSDFKTRLSVNVISVLKRQHKLVNEAADQPVTAQTLA